MCFNPTKPTHYSLSSDHTARLAAALQQIERLEREFDLFRSAAAQQLSDARSENRKLRAQLSTLQCTPASNPSPTKHAIKPTERMLSVEEMRAREVTTRRRSRRSLRPLRAVPSWGGDRAEGERLGGGKRMSVLARGFSRKWSGCF